jgi:hypothetical protein
VDDAEARTSECNRSRRERTPTTAITTTAQHIAAGKNDRDVEGKKHSGLEPGPSLRDIRLTAAVQHGDRHMSMARYGKH